MGQGTDTYQSERNLEREQTHERKKDESATGRNIPTGDGNVGDEQINALGTERKGKAIGQDHSTDHHETRDPDHGVGTIQESNDPTADVAHIDE
jgi:hypothetical protein